MKISEKWLRSWVDPDVSTDVLCAQLTDLGLEVDGQESVYENLSGVIVAQVESVEPIESDDSRNITKCVVNTGSEQVQVICGAPNVRVGMKSAYAQDGASLNDSDRVGTTRIYGFESVGMLCSGAELAIDGNELGILELRAELALGTDIKEALGLNDVSIDIDLTPNRGDCLSLRGIAREIGVVNRMSVEASAIKSVPARVNSEIPIELANPVGCPRYLGRIIEGIDSSARSPDWMVQRLLGSGLRPINPIVDVTNYVMLELGQPLHAFDLENVKKGIVVRDARKGESLTLLDGSEINFDAGTLLITDGDTPLAIAGVMGGERSGIQDDTHDVFLECAYFSPDAIIGTPRRYGLQTDASMRYERGVDPELQYDAIDRATELLTEIVGGQPGPITVAEARDELPSRRQITLRKQRLTKLVGETIEETEVEDAFTRLGFKFESDDLAWIVEAPSYRFDLGIEEDLVEEVCRIHGYNQINASHPMATLPFSVELNRESASFAVRNRVAELGYYEVVNYSFLDKDLNDRVVPEYKAPEVENPIASQYASMRKSLIPGLIASAQYNLSRQQDSIRLFEFGRCFGVLDGSTHQVDRIGGIALGSRDPENWASEHAAIDFYDVKGELEHVLALLRTNIVFERSNRAFLHPGQAAKIITSSGELGDFGKLHPELAMSMELPDHTYIFELDAEPFTKIDAPIAEHVAPFPYVRRDLALLIEDDVPVFSLCDAVRDELSDLLSDLTVFDVYRDSKLDLEKKSVGLGLVLQDKSATLTDAIVSHRMDALLAKLKSKFNASQR